MCSTSPRSVKISSTTVQRYELCHISDRSSFAYLLFVLRSSSSFSVWFPLYGHYDSLIKQMSFLFCFSRLFKWTLISPWKISERLFLNIPFGASHIGVNRSCYLCTLATFILSLSRLFILYLYMHGVHLVNGRTLRSSFSLFFFYSTRLALTGSLIVARDIAHAKFQELLEQGKPLPQYLKDHIIYYGW